MLMHEFDEENVYYETNYNEELVQNTSVIQEATLACDSLEEGFPQDRLSQTVLSGKHRPNKGVQVNRLPMQLQFRMCNIFTGDLCSNNEHSKSKLVQTLITYIY